MAITSKVFSIIKGNFLFKFLSSTKCAVVLLIHLVVAMGYGTILESIYGTTYANSAVYHANWFHSLLFFLALNLLLSVINRIPLRKSLLGFYIIHLSLVILLGGAAITHLWGIDGKIELIPNSPNSIVTIDEETLDLSDQQFNYSFTLPKTSKEKKLNWPLELDTNLSFNVLKYIPFAESVGTWEKKSGAWSSSWKVETDSWSKFFKLSNQNNGTLSNQVKIGPLQIKFIAFKNYNLLKEKLEKGKLDTVRNSPTVLISKKSYHSNKILIGFGQGDDWTFTTYGSGSFKLPWMGMRLFLLDEITGLTKGHKFTAIKPQTNNQMPIRALLIEYVKDQKVEKKWITNLSPTSIYLDKGKIDAFIYKRQIILPFTLELSRFHMDRIPGTMDSASYESFVRINNSKKLSHIYMNNPLKLEGFTFYQSSYYLGPNNKYHSILSVNKDPGRFVKYAGAFFLILGLVFHYMIIYRPKRATEVG